MLEDQSSTGPHYGPGMAPECGLQIDRASKVGGEKLDLPDEPQQNSISCLCQNGHHYQPHQSKWLP